MNDEIAKLFELVDGPEMVTPPQPKPHLSCNRCTFYQKSMADTGGLRGAPTYHKSCTHPEAWQEDSQLKGNNRSLNKNFHGGDSGHKTITPEWCPFLRK